MAVPKYDIKQGGIDELKEAVKQSRMEYAEDILSKAQANAPQGVTGALAGHSGANHSDDVSTVYFSESYAPYIEDGTEPFHMKLITIDLDQKIRKKLGRSLRKDKRGNVLVPILWASYPRVLESQ